MLNKLIAKPVEDSKTAARFKKQLQWMLFLRVVFLTLLLGINVLLQSTEKNIITPPFYYILIFVYAGSRYPTNPFQDIGTRRDGPKKQR